MPPLPSCLNQTPNAVLPAENQLEKLSQGMMEEILINQLLQIPEILSALSDPNLPSTSGLDTSAIFGDMDASFSTNFGTYQQDISQFNDIQFNMLVNENQNQNHQAEPQDSVLQVKMEEEQWGCGGPDQILLVLVQFGVKFPHAKEADRYRPRPKNWRKPNSSLAPATRTV